MGEGDYKSLTIFDKLEEMSKTFAGSRILLVRHAETAAPDRFHGAESDIGLSTWGCAQAEILGNMLLAERPSALFCSRLRRARETAQAIGRICGLDPAIITGLHERAIGPLSGMSREDGWAIYADCKQHWMNGDLEYSHVGGESFAGVGRRVVPILQRLAASHLGKTIVVVTHGVVIRVVLIYLLAGYSHGDFDRIAIDFASVNDLWYDGASWTSHALNQVVAGSTVRPVA
jgi:2,3-bisphosphoglycerate-dependent phosphoglycerate mutase